MILYLTTPTPNRKIPQIHLRRHFFQINSKFPFGKERRRIVALLRTGAIVIMLVVLSLCKAVFTNLDDVSL